MPLSPLDFHSLSSVLRLELLTVYCYDIVAEEGETTDEEYPPPESIARTRSVLRRPSWSSVDDADDLRTSGLMRRPALTGTGGVGHRRGPSMGSWIADPSKPIAVVDGSGKRLVIYPAQNPSPESPTLLDPPRSSDASTIGGGSPRGGTRGGSISELEPDRNELSSQELLSPTLSPGARLMVGSLVPGRNATTSTPRHHQHTSSAEFIIPGRLFAASPLVAVGGGTKRSAAHFDVEDDDDEDDDDDDEMMLNVHDFIDFGEDSSDDDHGERNHGDVGVGKGKMTKPATKKAKTSRNRSGSSGKMLSLSQATRNWEMSAGGGMGWMASSSSMSFGVGVNRGMGMGMGMGIKKGNNNKKRATSAHKRIRSC